MNSTVDNNVIDYLTHGLTESKGYPTIALSLTGTFRVESRIWEILTDEFDC